MTTRNELSSALLASAEGCGKLETELRANADLFGSS
jgi:hypothetical protein